MFIEMKPANNSICIPRAFANISEARVRKVFDALNIFVIDRVDMIQRKNEKGEPFQRIFVHIRTWSETAEAQKAKERLLSGNELKIVYDDPWFWKVALNTWAPKPAPKPSSLYNRKPSIRIEFDEDTANVNAATALLGSLNIDKEDQRPYRERRLDPVYCEQDRKQGFKDRRHKDDEQLLAESSFRQRFQPRSPSSSPPRRREETPKKTVLAPTAHIAQALPVIKEVIVTNTKVKPIERDQGLVNRMQHAFRCEITDEIYLNNRQNVRDQMETERSRPLQFGEPNINETPDYRNENGTAVVAPKKKTRKVIL
jgi:hypothetical protein